MIVCVGQVLLDHISRDADVPLAEATRFEACLGGSAANVAVGLHHHGVPVQLLSKVGDDETGQRARDALRAHGLDTTHIAVNPDRPTRSTRIGVDATGTPVLEIQDPRSADLTLQPEDVPPGMLSGAGMLYVSGTLLLAETSYRTALALLTEARARDHLIVFDPNIRPSRTPRPERVRERLMDVLPFVDLLQTSRRDWSDLWGHHRPRDLQQEGLRFLVLTAGSEGATLSTPFHGIAIPAESVPSVDPTGTGDAFLAALLSRIATLPSSVLADVSPEALQAWGRFAAGWAARVAQHRGATTVYGT